MQEISFTKMVASGNDFIIIDRSEIRNPKSEIRNPDLAKQLCQRKLFVGADGLLLIEPSKKADFKMRVFNPDGSEVDMCGNGARCVALYAAKKRICAAKMVIETRAGNLEAEVKQDKVKLKMSRPKDLRLRFNLDVDGQTQNANYINTGVPHLVSFLERLGGFNVIDAGKAIRYHSEFQPEGTNADFVQVLDKDHIALRTYERGVEEETLACGTGAVAASIITAYEMEEKPQGRYKIEVNTQSGETLTVYFKIKEDKIDEVFLEGKAKIVYKGGLYV